VAHKTTVARTEVDGDVSVVALDTVVELDAVNPADAPAFNELHGDAPGRTV
jgi:hypothetical protein